jgi:hypothetical protein
MKILSLKQMRSAVVLLALSVAPAFSFATPPQSAFTGASDAAAPMSPVVLGEAAANDIVSKVLAENKRRSDRLKICEVTRTYQIRTHEGKVAAQTVVHMEYRTPDVKAFEKTSEKGSGIVRHLVFDRLMDSENETSSGKEHHDSALTPANYAFHFVGQEDVGTHPCLVLEVTPRRKDKYLFEGKIWIESHDFAVVKIEGHPAKKPSFWINQGDFVREYQKLHDFWLPLRDEMQVDVKDLWETSLDHRAWSLRVAAGCADRVGYSEVVARLMYLILGHSVLPPIVASRRLPHRFDHFIASLNVFQLGLQQDRFSVEFMRRCCVGLRMKRFAFLQLLR